jgi:hypothetical protein
MVRMTLKVTVLAVIGIGLFNSVLQAADGDAAATARQYYVIQPGQRTRQPPNPTYWTHMPCPLTGHCDPCYGQKGIYTLPAIRWMLDPNYYGVAPDYGWGAPGRYPIQHNNVTYRRFHPSVYYGDRVPKQEVKRYPIIAQPTDTSQQGYYYQHVPVWGGPPKGLLPPAPHPHTWHKRPCALTPQGYYNKYLPIRTMLVPINQIPVVKDAAPAGGVGPGPMAVPVPMPNREAIPAPGPPRANAPEAINVPEVGNAVRRASFN